MENEDRIFYQNQIQFFGQIKQDHSYQYNQPLPLISNFSIQQPNHIQQTSNITNPKAYNPLDRLKDMPQQKQNQYFFMFNNHKRFNGIQHFFEFGSQQKYSSQFLQNIQMDVLRNNNNDFLLDRLFLGQNKQKIYKQQLQNMISSLNKKIQDINQKILQNVNINKTISHAFYQHFQNFTLVTHSTSFFQQFQNNTKQMIHNCKKFKGPGTQLISTIYQFWMKSFKDFINQIWKYSSKFTLNFFKKNQIKQCSPSEIHSNSTNSIEIRSESSNTIGSKDKRKGWSIEQTQILQQLINSNIIFSQSVLKKLGQQFNRSTSSISSKIQKITKSKKGIQQNNQQSLLKKIIQILKLYPQGLNRQTIIQKINQNYQMGYGGQWQKSIGQLLSNRKQFIKIKSKHKLINSNQYQILDINHLDKSKLTFKDKIIQIFLICPNAQADLKTLVDQYTIIFGDTQGDSESIGQERKKSIQANISKTLSRYDIFDRQAKTLYLINPIFNKVEARNMQIEVQSYFQL